MVQGRPRPRPGTRSSTADTRVGQHLQKTSRNHVAKQHFCQNLYLLATIAETQNILLYHKQERLESTEFNNLNKFYCFSNGLRPKCHSASVLQLGKHQGFRASPPAWAELNGPSVWMGMTEESNSKPNLKSKALSVPHDFGIKRRMQKPRCLNCQGDPS